MPIDKPEAFWMKLGGANTSWLIYLAGFAYFVRQFVRGRAGNLGDIADQLLLAVHWVLLAIWLWVVVNLWLENRREWREYHRSSQEQGTSS